MQLLTEIRIGGFGGQGVILAAAVIGKAGSVGPMNTVTIAADRPFFFAIRDLPTGQILFAGRITDPTAN